VARRRRQSRVRVLIARAVVSGDDGAMRLAPLAFVVLAGCGAKLVKLEPGTLQCKSGPHAGLAVTIAADKVVFTPAGGAPITRTVKAWPQEKWPNLCPAGMQAIRPEVVELGPDPLLLGTVEIKLPLLVADCRGGTSVSLKPTDPQGGASGPEVARFER